MVTHGALWWMSKMRHQTRRLANVRQMSNDNLNSSLIDKKLAYYSQFHPAPMSIAEFMEKGKEGVVTESASYKHLVQEILVRLSHLISEIRQFPAELQEQEEYQGVVRDYLLTYSEVLPFETKEPSTTSLSEGVERLKEAKERHSNVVPTMAAACIAMRKKYGLNLEENECALTQTVQYCLDRLYLSRISLNMLTNQHLMVYGHVATRLPGQIGVIHPHTDVEEIVKHAFHNAAFLCEQCYLHAPSLEIKSHNITKPNTKVTVTHIPSHIYHMTFEVMKNAMQATVETHWKSLETMPAIKVLVCQSDKDITIKISDQGGGVERAASNKMFKYLYTTNPIASLTKESVPLSGFGYGLPLSRLYARYFQGDIRAASYEGHGTDIYIYFQALCSNSVERLPIWGQTACDKMSVKSSPISDWTPPTSHVIDNDPIEMSACAKPA